MASYLHTQWIFRDIFSLYDFQKKREKLWHTIVDLVTKECIVRRMQFREILRPFCWHLFPNIFIIFHFILISIWVSSSLKMIWLWHFANEYNSSIAYEFDLKARMLVVKQFSRWFNLAKKVNEAFETEFGCH